MAAQLRHAIRTDEGKKLLYSVRKGGVLRHSSPPLLPFVFFLVYQVDFITQGVTT